MFKNFKIRTLIRITYIFIFLLSISLINTNINAEDEIIENTTQEISIESQKVEIEKLWSDLLEPYLNQLNAPVHINNSKNIQVQGLIENLSPYKWVTIECIFSDKVIKPSKDWECIYRFKTPWYKSVSIQFVDKDSKTIFSFSYKILVYQKSIPAFINKKVFPDITKLAWEQWIFLYELSGTTNNLNAKDLIDNLSKYNSLEEEWKQDYIFIASDITNEISFLNAITPYMWVISNKYNLILSNNSNINTRTNLITKFLSWKEWIKKIILTDNLSHTIIFTEDSFSDISTHLKKNNYTLINISNNSNIEIKNYLFLSKFINTLWNMWVDFKTIEIFLEVIVLILLITVFKHVIWIWWLWIMLPVLLSVNIAYNSNYYIIWVFILITAFNYLIFKVLKKHVLLYLPKIAFVITLDIFLVIILINILATYNLVLINSISIITILTIVLMSERLVWIMGSKDFSEYKWVLINTMLISIICWTLFMIPTINQTLIIYPEVLLFTPTIIIWLARWWGLRLTEYFRFREVMGNIEEE